MPPRLYANYYVGTKCGDPFEIEHALYVKAKYGEGQTLGRVVHFNNAEPDADQMSLIWDTVCEAFPKEYPHG